MLYDPVHERARISVFNLRTSGQPASISKRHFDMSQELLRNVAVGLLIVFLMLTSNSCDNGGTVLERSVGPFKV